ncbi:alpha-amylase [Jatrophihabitans fulvus]
MRRRHVGFAAAAIALATAGTLAVAVQPTQARPESHRPAQAREARSVVANLFEWNWNSVARECRTVLGPSGYGAVQVSPPADSLKRTKLGDGSDTVLNPWWEVYQPVRYALTSRMGTERQFRQMVTTCRKAGVQVIVDAVLNHMTGQGDTSYGGVTYERYRYAGLYENRDFHKYSGDCPSASGGIEDFNNQQQVFNCELVGLSDLRTDTPKVRATLAGYLNKLLSYGVSGFRVDAAKHVGQRDLDAIYAKLRKTVDGTRPYWALEVFGGGPGTLSPQAFVRSGTVLGLDGVKQLQAAFKSYPAEHVGSIATLRDFGENSGLTPSGRTLSFVQNHDTERNGDGLNYKDGRTNIIANQFVLAYGYGRPQVFSGFAWQTTDDSPPATADGIITDTDCSSGWVCVDRDPGVRAMVRFHNEVGDARVRNWQDDGANLIGFARGDRGWVAINNGTEAKTMTFTTGLRQGSYRDLVHGGTVRVGPNGKATVTVPAKDTVAILR